MGADLVTLAVIAGAYLLGCIATGYYLVRMRFGTDIRQTGSGNIGATNVARLLGPCGFLLTLLGDAGKGVVAMLMAVQCQLAPWALWGALVAVIAGHVWPAQLRFRGGKGVAPYLGALFYLDWRIGFLLGALGSLGMVLTRHFTIGGLIGFALLPIALVGLGYPVESVAGAGVASAVLLWAHRTNIWGWRDQMKLDEGLGTE